MLLDTPADDNRGLRRDDLISKDARPRTSPPIARATTRGARARRRCRSAARSPRCRSMTATEWANRRAGRPRRRCTRHHGPTWSRSSKMRRHRAAPIRPALRRPRPRAARRRAARRRRRSGPRLARLHARVLGAPDDERDEAARVVDRVLASSGAATRRAPRGPSCRREAPVSIVLDGALVDGQVDLAFETRTGWTVVDFKTDVELGRPRRSIAGRWRSTRTRSRRLPDGPRADAAAV